MQGTTLPRLGRAARFAALRLRVDKVVARLFFLLPIALTYAVAVLTAIKVARPTADVQGALLWAGMIPLGVLVGGVLHACLCRRPRHLGALALDRHHGLHDRITNALSFREVPAGQRTPLMDAAIEDALSVAVDLRPRRAAPLHLPREVPIVVLLTAGLLGVALLEVRTVRELPPPESIQALVMAPDDIELFRDAAEQLQERNQDAELLAAARRFNQLIEDIAQRRLQRSEVFRRLEELERELLKGAEAEQEALDEGLRSIARELERSDLSKPIAKAFEEKRLEDAEQALRELAKRLKRKGKPPNKAQLQKLRDALKQASQANAARAKRLDEQRRKLAAQRKSLLSKQRSGAAGLTEKQQRKLRQLERKLDRLQREKSRLERARKGLSKLDRDLAKAAADLMKQLGVSAEDLESAAADVNRMAREKMTRKEKEALRRRLQELRELIRQQGKGGKQRLQRLMRFGRRARGQPGKKGGKGGKSGKGRSGKAVQLGGPGGDMVVIGPAAGGQSIPMPGAGAPGPTPGAQGQGAGSGQPGGSEDWGEGHDPKLKGDKSKLKGTTHDVSAAGVDTGEGTASSQVVFGAAARGFVGRGYQRVYTDYRTVAEQVMKRDEIPPGYRFYVRRYFQLIRPRE